MSKAHSNTETKAPRSSSFLDSFLSDAPEPAPYTSAPEDAKISDRSAFDKQDLSIEEIVSGSGVSSITNFPASQPAPASRVRPPMPTRESAIPLAPPKKFKSHSLTSFPDKPQRPTTTSSSTKRQVPPTTYRTGAFSSFRSISTQARRLFSTTTQLNSNSTTPKSRKNPRLRQIPDSSRPEPTPVFTGPRPTEMSAKQLLENKQFRRMRWQWTALIVGIPVLIVSTYHLYQRADFVDREKKEEQELEDLRTQKRERGVLPGYENGKA